MVAPIQQEWEQLSGKLKMTMVRFTTSYYQMPSIHLQLKLDYCHHNIGLKSETKEEIHTVQLIMMQ